MMAIRTASASQVLERFLETNVEQSPALQRFVGRELRMTRLFEVRTASVDDIASGDLLETQVVSGWWAFILRQDDEVVGIAALKLTPESLVFDGVDTSSLGPRAAEALRRLEEDLGDRDAEAWFLRVTPLFFTAAVAAADDQRWIVPATGSRSPAELQQVARDRMEAGAKLQEMSVESIPVEGDDPKDE